MAMTHGGDLADAIQRYGGEWADWLDLSTGIHQRSYGFDPSLAADDLNALPSNRDLFSCLDAARLAYGADGSASLVAAPGTQALIQLLPLLLRACLPTARRCLIAGPTYSEHAASFALHGFEHRLVPSIADQFSDGDCVLLVNPNNPDGRLWQRNDLIDLALKLEEAGGALIVDEAFCDLYPDYSLVPDIHRLNNCVTLRSFGKFFGLAGVRLGFALGPEVWMDQLRCFLGPWSVSSSALRIGRAALNDLAWQEDQRALLSKWAGKQKHMLQRTGFEIIGGSDLFQLIQSPRAHAIHQHLVKRSIWSRIFDYDDSYLRLGIVIDELNLDRLKSAMESFKHVD